MKKILILIVFVLSFVDFANAQSGKRIAIHVPFDFFVQNQEMPVGDYFIETFWTQSNNRPLVLREKRGRANAILSMIPHELSKTGKPLALIIYFKRYGDEFFMSAISNPIENYGFNIKSGKTENRLNTQSKNLNTKLLALDLRQR